MMEFSLRRRWSLVLVAMLSLVALLVVACGGDDDDDDAATTVATAVATSGAGTTTAATATVSTAGKIDYAKLGGEVRIDGSSTVFPISEAVAEEFSKVAKNVKANVAFSGTGGGFEKFCRGDIQVSNASRPINQKETDACKANNITDQVELQVAIDALTVVINPQNTWAKCMTTAQLTAAFKADGFKKWKDIDPSWPDETIKFFTPGADSGTFDYFKEATKLRGTASNEPPHRADVTASEDDNVLVKGVEGDKYALGYFGFAFFEEAGKNLKAVDIDGGKGCVTPTFDNALAGTYTPLSRPLFIYVRESAMKERPEILGFIKFYLDNSQKLSKEVGYISLPADLQTKQQDKIKALLPK